ncbi:hypothetical protein [Streptomyces sp. AC627_RSS907]|uniref:hypothetical protein n=1 Tax=Streptomyces sp. AC627_RSS907 TaxID=2823684 RepID=UPI001C2165E5|nr:hypothetical protein [Streptomyces sp. AC627_RSS907]
MLRSVLVAAFSAVVAFGALNGLVTAQGDERANGAESVTVVFAAPAGQDTTAITNDTVWS